VAAVITHDSTQCVFSPSVAKSPPPLAFRHSLTRLHTFCYIETHGGITRFRRGHLQTRFAYPSTRGITPSPRRVRFKIRLSPTQGHHAAVRPGLLPSDRLSPRGGITIGVSVHHCPLPVYPPTGHHILVSENMPSHCRLSPHTGASQKWLTVNNAPVPSVPPHGGITSLQRS